MFGPMSVASSRGSPWRRAAARSRKRAVNSAATRSSTSSRVPARHTWPALSYWPTAWRDGQVQVGVGEHQQRGLAAQFQRDRGQPGPGRGGDQAAGRDRAGEADAGQAGVRRERRAGLGAETLHDVEHAVGQAGVAGDVREQARGQRRPLRRLGHHRVARGQGGRDPPGGQHQRRVPRRDHRGDAGRGPGHPLPVPGDLPVAGVEPAEPVGEEPEVERRPRHHPAPVRAQQRAVVPGLDLGEVLGAPVDAVGYRVKDLGPAPGRGARPAAERLPRGLHRRVDLRLGAAGDLGDRLLVDGGDVGERRGRAGPAAPDPVPGVDADAGHVRSAHRSRRRSLPPGSLPDPARLISFGPKLDFRPGAVKGRNRPGPAAGAPRRASTRPPSQVTPTCR